MRTKILLTAAAALAAGLVTSNAQVYSANVVGYVTVNAPAGATSYTLICNPLDNGTNDLNSLVSPPSLSHVLIWNGTGFDTYNKTASGWTLNGNPADPIIAPGQAFFLQPRGTVTVTNVFVGSVAAAPGASVTNSLPEGASAYSLVGSMIPFADTLNGTNLNLTVPSLSHVLLWNGSGFDTYNKTASGWTLNGSPADPPIDPGHGMFVQPRGTGTYEWVQTLPAN